MAVLEVVRGADAGLQFELRPPASVVGSSTDADVRVADSRIGAAHCRITRVGASWCVEDLGADGGTLVNGEAVEVRRALSAGDELRLGSTVFRFIEFHSVNIFGEGGSDVGVETFESVLDLPESAFDVPDDEFDLSETSLVSTDGGSLPPGPGRLPQAIPPASAVSPPDGVVPARPMPRPQPPAPAPQATAGFSDATTVGPQSGLGVLDDPFASSAPQQRAPAPAPAHPAGEADMSGDWSGLFDAGDRAVASGSDAPAAPPAPPHQPPPPQARPPAPAPRAQPPRPQPPPPPPQAPPPQARPAPPPVQRAPQPAPQPAPAPAPAPAAAPLPATPADHSDELELKEVTTDLVARFPEFGMDGILARGPLWHVFSARHLESERRVALKVVSAESGLGPGDVRALIEQARNASHVASPHLVRTIAAGTHDGLLYVATEFIDGQTLDQFLAAQEGGRLPWRQALAVARQIALGLAHAESAQALHLHLHPGNVICGNDGVWRVVDLGVWGPPLDARLACEAGVPNYLAPEHARGEPVNIAADVYGLGALLYQMLSGRVPFAEEKPPHLEQRVRVGKPDPVYWMVPGLPRPLTVIVDKLMAHHAGARYTSFHDVVRDLEAVPLDEFRFDKRKVIVRKSFRMAGGGIIAAAVMLAVGWGALAIWRSAKDNAEQAAAEIEVPNALEQAEQAVENVAAVVPMENLSEEGRRAFAAVQAIADSAALLEPLCPDNADDWMLIADRYEALLGEFSSSILIIQQAAIRSRDIRTEAMIAGLDQQARVTEGWQREFLESLDEGADLPEDVPASLMGLPDASTADAETLTSSYETTLELADGLRREGRATDALRLVRNWSGEAAALSDGDPAVGEVIERGRTWVREQAARAAALVAHDLEYDRRAMLRAFASSCPIPDGDERGPFEFGRPAEELNGALAVLRTPPYRARVRERLRRLDLAQAAWASLPGAIADGLVRNGAELPGGRGALDLSRPPNAQGILVRAAGADDGRRVAWSELSRDLLVETFVVPLALRGEQEHREGALWLLVELREADAADAALDGAGQLPKATREAIRAEMAALWAGRSFGLGAAREALFATDQALILRRQQAASADRLFTDAALLAALLDRR